MVDNELTNYSDKRSYNNLPVPEGQYLAPFLVHNWDEVKAMNYHRENLETWHFSGIAVLVAFTPVTAEQFPGTMKLFWSDVRTYIADLKKDPNILSYDKISNMEPSSLQPLPHQTNRRNRLVVVPAQRTNLQFSFFLACHVFVLLFQSTILA